MESAPVSTLSPQTSWQQVAKSSPGLERKVKHMLANFQCGSRGGAAKQRTSLELRIDNYPFVLIEHCS